MAFDKKTEALFLEITEKGILKEVSSLPKITAAETFISTANLAIRQIIGTVIHENGENPSENLKIAQADIWEILENARVMVNLCIMADKYNDLKSSLEEE